ncbi:hypothetical protein [Benzoatithermus flavus]|uniref:DUF1127 domain-containing protein n=1 Tax=Benzoatithermus flavus TaxID=3108223 RepID=A0ABU8XN55_9PROT
MSPAPVTARASRAPLFGKGWLMRRWRALRTRPARPRALDPGELSPHLLKDIGLWDDPASPAGRIDPGRQSAAHRR